MKGFVIGHGRSGTKWVAAALSLSTDLKTHHESMRHELGEDFGGVEVNGRFWDKVPTIKQQFPKAETIHLVRDGRLVVRSVLSRKKFRTLEDACKRWDRRNRQLIADIEESHRFRLEDLTTDFGCFERMATLLGATYVNPKNWQQIRSERINANQNTYPDPANWSKAQREIFWSQCGDTMIHCGYGKELGT